MCVLEGDDGGVLERQTHFKGDLSAIELQCVIGKREPEIRGWIEPAVSVVPRLIVFRAETNEPKLRSRNLQAEIVIVVVIDSPSIHSQSGILVHLLLVMQIFNPAERI